MDEPTKIFNIIVMIVYIGALAFLIGLLLIMLCSRKKERNITIVKKRVTTRNLLNDPKINTGYQSSSTYEYKNVSVDFVYAGKKKINTLFCSDKLYNIFTEGNTYRVGIKYPNILYIVDK